MSHEGWKKPDAGEACMKMVDVVAPGRKDILQTIARTTAGIPSERLRIMDIGCGWGQVTEEILKCVPDFSVLRW